jgi:cobyrinic acid a,c-diamide synthase
LIAGLNGDSGKTTVCLGIIAALRNKGVNISVFKKGPDYIDSLWLSKFAGSNCRNLDTFMVSPDDVYKSFVSNAIDADIAIIEGNRGIFDGKDVQGTHSSAELAKLLHSPIILVVDATKATRTLAAVIMGIISFDNKLDVKGVILNKIAGERHLNIISKSIKKYCNIPIVGTIPKLTKDRDSEIFPLIKNRHLGLTTPDDFINFNKLKSTLLKISDKNIDIDAIRKIAQSTQKLNGKRININSIKIKKNIKKIVKIGYLKDSSFNFYYPENLEALEKRGAELIALSSNKNKYLPDNLDGLYIGGGFPEFQAENISKNKSLLSSVRLASEKGLPIYAECGGLIFLSKSITWKNNKYKMAGIIPIDVKMENKPVGHGYVSVIIDKQNPFFKKNVKIKGHLFHYTRILSSKVDLKTCMHVITEDKNLKEKRDGLIYNNTFASYLHIHANGVKSWAKSFIKLSLKYKSIKESGIINRKEVVNM